MYNAININPDSVEFEATVGGYNQIVNLERPDGVSYSQWSGVWSGFKELHDSRQYSLDDYVERQVDTSEIESLEDRIDELKGELKNAENDRDDAEAEVSRIQYSLDDCVREKEVLEAELREVNARLSVLEG